MLTEQEFRLEADRALEGARPSGAPPGPSEVLRRIEGAEAAFLAWVEAEPRALAEPARVLHPGLGPLSALEWARHQRVLARHVELGLAVGPEEA